MLLNPPPAPASVPPCFPPYAVGEFETHVTFDCTDVEGLAEWGSARGAGLTHIVLARGATPSQPMLTWRGTTCLDAARDAAHRLARAAGGRGFAPVRVKIEAAPWHPGVPGTDAEARTLGPAYYFEHHVKLLLDRDCDLGALGERVTAHGAHVSHNARRVRRDGRCERFVTQRCRSVGDRAARAAFTRLVADLELVGHHLLSAEREFVVFDDNGALDEGWIGGEAGPCV